MNDVINFLNEKINKDDLVIVACSGGPDSMCLLSLVLTKTKNIICAHVNHNIRRQSLEEYNYVENFCKKHNIIFEGLNIRFENTNNFENNARKKRYEFFIELKEKYNAKYILTAHHGDDLIETVLMRITRGSKLSGYLGIKKENNVFLRPLLYVTKEDIYKYLNSHNITYYIDETNYEENHQRNRYRKVVIPFLKKEDKNVHRKYLKFSEELENYDNFVNNYIKKLGLINFNKNYIYIDKVKKESKFIRKKVVELLIKIIQENDYLEVNDNVLLDLVNALLSSKSNIEISLNNGYVAQKNYNIFTIKKKLNIDNYCIIFDSYFENNDYIIKKVDNISANSNYVIRLNSNDINLPIIIRNRKDGDKIFVKNLGLKKVKDILINEKINIDKRKNLPIVTDSKNNVLWIPGIKKSKFDIGKNKNCDIILLCERKDENEKC
ncbi:MAG: tRNA lysidine(34) synthetase TilS [Bacilli bacterium]